VSADLRGIFREIEPPPGGAERFARRLDALVERAPAPRWRLAAAAAAAVALVAALGFAIAFDAGMLGRKEPALVATLYDAPQFDRLLGRPPTPTGLSVRLDDRDATVAELASANAKVRIYRIEPQSPPP